IIMENLPLDHNEFALAAEAAPNNNNGWIEWDVPLGGEMDEPMVDPEFYEEEMDDDDGWEEDDEWLMAPVVTPPKSGRSGKKLESLKWISVTAPIQAYASAPEIKTC
ncbi:hypothetical protein Tco_0021401, partial [Tanacetum coccineum]